MKNPRRIAELIAAAVVLACGCTPEPIVGLVRPVSGPEGAYGQSVDRGVELALADAVDSAELPDGFRMVRVDTVSDPQRAATEVQRLVSDQGVRIVLGAVTSAEAEAMIPVLEESKVVCVSPCASSADLGRRSPYLYRIAPNDEVEGRTAARHLIDERGIDEIMVYTDDSRLTRDVEAEFRQHFEMKLGGTVIETIHMNRKKWRKHSADFLAAHEPDAVYIVGHADRILEVLAVLEESRYRGVRCTTSTFFLEDVLTTADDLADGVIFPLPTYDVGRDDGPTAVFAEHFGQRYGRRPDIFAAQGYDAMKVTLRSLAMAQSLFTPEIRKALNFDLHDFPGVTGPIDFDEAGAVRRYPVMHCVKDGRVKPCSVVREEMRESIRGYLSGLRGAA
jgi:branched-chain amino acid transport system substrate-binding protein